MIPYSSRSNFCGNLYLFQTVWLNKLNEGMFQMVTEDALGQTGNGHKVFSHACILDEVLLWKYIISRGMFLKKNTFKCDLINAMFSGLINSCIDFSLQFIIKENEMAFGERYILWQYSSYIIWLLDGVIKCVWRCLPLCAFASDMQCDLQQHDPLSIPLFQRVPADLSAVLAERGPLHRWGPLVSWQRWRGGGRGGGGL